MRRFLRVIGLLLCIVFLCIMLGAGWLMQFLTVTSTTASHVELPNILLTEDGRPIETVDDWEKERVLLLDHFKHHVYGNLPDSLTYTSTTTLLDTSAYSDTATVELLTLTFAENLALNVVFILPKGATSSPVLITSNFCPTYMRYPEYSLPIPSHYPSMCGESSMTPLVHFVFGEYIERHPVEMLLQNGIGIADMYLAELVPDDEQLSKHALAKLALVHRAPLDAVIGAWALEYDAVARALAQDARVNTISIYGHSRDGKAALLASALSNNVDSVIAHQSGIGGARPARTKTGENIAQVCKEYPHWFSQTFCSFSGREDELPVDQHELIALSAPKPVLLTGARLDKWADPQGSLFAMQQASLVYTLYGVPLYLSDSLTYFSPTSTLSFYFREAFHGARKSDWNAFITFISSH